MKAEGDAKKEAEREMLRAILRRSYESSPFYDRAKARKRAHDHGWDEDEGKNTARM